MLHNVNETEKSLKGMIKRFVRFAEKHRALYCVLYLFLRIARKLVRFYKYSGVFGAPKALRFRISKKQRDAEESFKFEKNIKFSVLVPLYNTPQKYLEAMIESVKNQTYSDWELCLADGSDSAYRYVGEYCQKCANEDSRIVYKKLERNGGISQNTNECIAMSSGDYISLFDHDDLLHPSALFETAKAICEQGADFVYTDEITFCGKSPRNIVLCNFKPDYSPDTLRSYNYICHFTSFSKSLLNMVGGFDSEFDGSQDYDLFLRLTEKAENIVHIKKALYFWRSHKASVASDVSAKPYVTDSAKRALSAHLNRISLKGEIYDGAVPTTYRIEYEIEDEPLISIIIPNKDHAEDLDKCIKSIYEKSTYRNFEIIIVENNSCSAEIMVLYEKLQSQYDNLKIVKWESGFNYSAINNFAVSSANGEYILLLNNDVEVISEDWLSQMLMLAQRSDVGAVGAKLYFPNDSIQHAGVIVGLGGVAGHAHKYFDRADPGYMARASIVQNLSACTAACLMIRRDVYELVGGLDEKYEVAFNDIDFCMKIRRAGYLIVFTPYAELYHYESISRGSDNTPQKRERFNGEARRFMATWRKELDEGDPYYNPNLTLNTEDFALK